MTDSVKTFNGIAVAAIKTFNGIAAASVKSIGGISKAAFAAYDPAAKSAHITLSGGNLIVASDNDASYQNVASTPVKSSGVLQCEWTLVRNGLSARRLGLSLASDSVADGVALGASATSYAFDTTVAHTFHNGDTGAYGSVSGAGIVVGMVWDAGAATVHFYRSGVDMGLAFSGVTGSFRIHATGFGNEVDHTLNTGATAFAFPVGGATGWTA